MKKIRIYITQWKVTADTCVSFPIFQVSLPKWSKLQDTIIALPEIWIIYTPLYKHLYISFNAKNITNQSSLFEEKELINYTKVYLATMTWLAKKNNISRLLWLLAASTFLSRFIIFLKSS